MLRTRYFVFNRHGELTIFAMNISSRNLVRILKMCVKHARIKKIRKPCKFRLIPTLTEYV